MATLRFDLNDIFHEPSDEQLASLMEAVAVEVRRRGQLARDLTMDHLRQAIEEVQQQRGAE